MSYEIGMWIGIALPIVIGCLTAIILAFSAGREKPDT